jgi:hypothetical protein
VLDGSWTELPRGSLEGLFVLAFIPKAQQKAMPIATAIAGDRTELLAVPLDHDFAIRR